MLEIINQSPIIPESMISLFRIRFLGTKAKIVEFGVQVTIHTAFYRENSIKRKKKIMK